MDECARTATQQKAGIGGPSPALDLNGRQYGALQAEAARRGPGWFLSAEAERHPVVRH